MHKSVYTTCFHLYEVLEEENETYARKKIKIRGAILNSSSICAEVIKGDVLNDVCSLL